MFKLLPDRSQLHGVGVGLRPQHIRTIIETQPDIPWLEALTDNYLHLSGPAFHNLCTISEQYPVSLHGVGLNIGSHTPLDHKYLKALKRLAQTIQAPLISDHLAWTQAHGHYTHELIPFEFTHRRLEQVASRVQQVQEYLGQVIMLENVSRYVTYNINEMTEADFLTTLHHKTGCGILLDVNNCYVNYRNHQDPIEAFFETLPKEAVWQMHLAGFSDKEDHLLDSHSEPVHQAVWDWYAVALDSFPHTPTLIEWDQNLPPWPVLHAEAQKAQAIMDKQNIEVSA